MVGEWHGGKGSKRRNANDTAYADNWEKIFGKKNDKKDRKEVQRKRTGKQQKNL